MIVVNFIVGRLFVYQGHFEEHSILSMQATSLETVDQAGILDNSGISNSILRPVLYASFCLTIITVVVSTTNIKSR